MFSRLPLGCFAIKVGFVRETIVTNVSLTKPIILLMFWVISSIIPT